jgi:hypothetical protein
MMDTLTQFTPPPPPRVIASEVKVLVRYILTSESVGPWYISDPEIKNNCSEGTNGSWYCERLKINYKPPSDAES